MLNINFIVVFIIKLLIIINLINQIKSKYILLQDSIIYLKIKGIGENTILGNRTYFNFKGINHLKYVYINEKQQNSIEYKYYFNQTDNSVKLIFDDDLEDCGYMFSYCINITEINLSNFNTLKVTTMYYMFYNCSSLTSLDLSNFNTLNVDNMASMFSYCSSLSSLDLSSFDTSKVSFIDSMFYKCINLEYINLNKFKENHLIFYDNIFFGVPENIVICIDENNIKNKILPQISNIACHTISCSNDWKSIQKMIINNTNECIDSCENSNQYKFEYNGKCYEHCPNGFLYDENNNQLNKCKCELDKCLTCPNVALNKNLCTKCNINYYSKENDPSNLGEYINCYSKINKIEYYDYILTNIEQELTSESFDTTDLDKGKDKIIEKEKLKITFTTTQNQRNNIFNNMTKIDIVECETKLRNFYHIPDNETLYMKKIDIYQEGMKTIKVEYDVYAKLFGNNLINLNLTVCGTSKISISIPIIINDDLDKYNSSSGYYNDICYTTTSDDGTDILLKDRQKEFIDKDKVVCQEDCYFSEYDYDTFVAKCSCEAKDCAESFADMSINKTKLLDNFINIKNFMNFKFLICYKKLFNKHGILNNIGCYLLLLINIFHIFSILIFSGKQFSQLKKKIKAIIYEKKMIKKIINVKLRKIIQIKIKIIGIVIKCILDI